MSAKAPARSQAGMNASIRLATASDEEAVEALMAASFGPARHNRSVRHLRLGPPEAQLSFVCEKDAQIIGSIRYWPILVGGKRQLLLGPLAVLPDYKGQGFGRDLVSHSLSVAQKLAYDFILISGEPDYYPRFGFQPAADLNFLWPGFIEPERLQIKYLTETGAKDTLVPPMAKAILPMV